MGRIRTLNGIPNEVTQKYLSTFSYGEASYTAHWIWKRMNTLGIDEAEIDIFNESTTPQELKDSPITYQLSMLCLFIEKLLKNYKFESDFINNGIIKITINNRGEDFGNVEFLCVLMTKDNRQIIGKIHKHGTYPIADSLFEKALSNLN
jgi:hypothetical protein